MPTVRTILLFGATGSAGASVLNACLTASGVQEIRAIVRRSPKRTDSRLKVIIHDNFEDYSAIESVFRGVDACFFCLGKSMTHIPDERMYSKVTKDFAVAAAQMLKGQSPDASFHFISGQGSNANSRFMWARVKGTAENKLMQEFGAVCWRPAAIDGELVENAPLFLKLLHPFIQFMSPFRGLYIAGEDLGRAMMVASRENVRNRIVENREIRDLADRFSE